MGESKDHPFIKPSDFVRALMSRRRLDLLLPAATLDESRPVLKEYWRRFRMEYGADHEVFSHCSTEALELTVPCKIHGDEGRSALGVYRKFFSCTDSGFTLLFLLRFHELR